MFKAYSACGNGKLLVTTDPLAVTRDSTCRVPYRNKTELGSVLFTALPQQLLGRSVDCHHLQTGINQQ